MRYSNRSNPSPTPFLPLIDQGHPPPPSRWLEPNNRELILLFESYLVDVFLYFAPLRLFTPLFEGPIQTPSPPLFFVSSFDSFPRLFHSVRFDLERKRERRRPVDRPCSFEHKSCSSARTIFKQVLSTPVNSIFLSRGLLLSAGIFEGTKRGVLYTILDGSASFRLVS